MISIDIFDWASERQRDKIIYSVQFTECWKWLCSWFIMRIFSLLMEIGILSGPELMIRELGQVRHGIENITQISSSGVIGSLPTENRGLRNDGLTI